MVLDKVETQFRCPCRISSESPLLVSGGWRKVRGRARPDIKVLSAVGQERWHTLKTLRLQKAMQDLSLSLTTSLSKAGRAVVQGPFWPRHRERRWNHGQKRTFA